MQQRQWQRRRGSADLKNPRPTVFVACDRPFLSLSILPGGDTKRRISLVYCSAALEAARGKKGETLLKNKKLNASLKTRSLIVS